MSKAAQRSLPPSHDLHHVSILAPELGVHVGLSHLAVVKLATPAGSGGGQGGHQGGRFRAG